MRYFRGWAVEGANLHLQLWNEPTSDGPVFVESLTVTAVVKPPPGAPPSWKPSPTGAVLLSMADLAVPHDLVNFGASSPRGVSLNNDLSTMAEVRACLDEDFIGGQLFNLALEPYVPYTIPLGTDLDPGRGVGIRIPENALTRFGWVWSEEASE